MWFNHCNICALSTRSWRQMTGLPFVFHTTCKPFRSNYHNLFCLESKRKIGNKKKKKNKQWYKHFRVPILFSLECWNSRLVFSTPFLIKLPFYYLKLVASRVFVVAVYYIDFVRRKLKNRALKYGSYNLFIPHSAESTIAFLLLLSSDKSSSRNIENLWSEYMGICLIKSMIYFYCNDCGFLVRINRFLSFWSFVSHKMMFFFFFLYISKIDSSCITPKNVHAEYSSYRKR